MKLKELDLDKVWVGIILGLIAPLIVYGLYNALVNKLNLKTVNISLCMVIELLPFYITLNREMYKATKIGRAHV